MDGQNTFGIDIPFSLHDDNDASGLSIQVNNNGNENFRPGLASSDKMFLSLPVYPHDENMADLIPQSPIEVSQMMNDLPLWELFPGFTTAKAGVRIPDPRSPQAFAYMVGGGKHDLRTPQSLSKVSQMVENNQFASSPLHTPVQKRSLTFEDVHAQPECKDQTEKRVVRTASVASYYKQEKHARAHRGREREIGKPVERETSVPRGASQTEVKNLSVSRCRSAPAMKGKQLAVTEERQASGLPKWLEFDGPYGNAEIVETSSSSKRRRTCALVGETEKKFVRSESPKRARLHQSDSGGSAYDIERPASLSFRRTMDKYKSRKESELKALMRVNPKKAKRVLANRKSACRSRERQLQRTLELEEYRENLKVMLRDMEQILKQKNDLIKEQEESMIAGNSASAA